MASIEVYRGAGDRPGAPIIEPLLSEAVLIQRGTAEMDRYAQPVQTVEIDALFRDGLELGQLCEVVDPSRATPRRGRTTGIALQFDGGALECRITLEAAD